MQMRTVKQSFHQREENLIGYKKVFWKEGSISHQAPGNALEAQSKGKLADQVIRVGIMGPHPTVHFQNHELDLALNVAEVVGQETVALEG